MTHGKHLIKIQGVQLFPAARLFLAGCREGHDIDFPLPFRRVLDP